MTDGCLVLYLILLQKISDNLLFDQKRINEIKHGIIETSILFGTKYICETRVIHIFVEQFIRLFYVFHPGLHIFKIFAKYRLKVIFNYNYFVDSLKLDIKTVGCQLSVLKVLRSRETKGPVIESCVCGRRCTLLKSPILIRGGCLVCPDYQWSSTIDRFMISI